MTSPVVVKCLSSDDVPTSFSQEETWRHQFVIIGAMTSSVSHQRSYDVTSLSQLWRHQFLTATTSPVSHSYDVICFSQLWRHQFLTAMTSPVSHSYDVICFSQNFLLTGMAMGILLGEMAEASQWIFGLAGGMFLYISLVDMVSVFCRLYRACRFSLSPHQGWPI